VKLPSLPEPTRAGLSPILVGKFAGEHISEHFVRATLIVFRPPNRAFHYRRSAVPVPAPPDYLQNSFPLPTLDILASRHPADSGRAPTARLQHIVDEVQHLFLIRRAQVPQRTPGASATVYASSASRTSLLPDILAKRNCNSSVVHSVSTARAAAGNQSAVSLPRGLVASSVTRRGNLRQLASPRRSLGPKVDPTDPTSALSPMHSNHFSDQLFSSRLRSA
jgi:hypothetical protein